MLSCSKENSETLVREKPAKAPQHAYRLVILNDFDRPETRMIALVRDAGDGAEWTYISADKRFGGRYLKWLPLRYPEHTTDLQTFGVKPVIEIREGQHRIRVDRISGSLATYSDGVSRRWQGHSESVSTVRPELVPALKRWSAQSP